MGWKEVMFMLIYFSQFLYQWCWIIRKGTCHVWEVLIIIMLQNLSKKKRVWPFIHYSNVYPCNIYVWKKKYFSIIPATFHEFDKTFWYFSFLCNSPLLCFTHSVLISTSWFSINFLQCLLNVSYFSVAFITTVRATVTCVVWMKSYMSY